MINCNGKLYDQPVMEPDNNRGFAFGDGVFETIIYANHTLRYFGEHIKRLAKGLRSLRIEPGFVDWEKEIGKVTDAAGLSKARVKVACWRGSARAAGYTPGTDKMEFMISAVEFRAMKMNLIRKVDVCRSVTLNETPCSAFKTLSSLPYVLAALEREERALEELIITDNHGDISECTSSNIFWIKSNKLYTSPLSAGCIAGVMRSVIKEKFEVKERRLAYKDLRKAESIFTTNVAGMGIVTKLGDTNLNPGHRLMAAVKRLWEL